MAKQVDRMNIVISYERQDDGSYITSVAVVEGSVSDPAAGNEYDKGPHPCNASETWNGGQTGDAMVAACLAALKTAGGVP